ncbi:MAG: hypothetical protein JWM21_1567 [Acidobacteria bacterium]|jgi:hypothetical protein|nr:hypothetical protein [Acidobacteriota bacterium]
MSSQSRELVIPPGASASASSVEILRAWQVNDSLHVSLKSDAWKEANAWGLVLADIARHVADALRQTSGINVDDTLDEIRYMFNAELLNPTDEPTGGFIQ